MRFSTELPSEINTVFWDHSFRTYAKFSEKLKFLKISFVSQLSAYSHTNLLFEYINFKKIIHEREFFVM